MTRVRVVALWLCLVSVRAVDPGKPSCGAGGECGKTGPSASHNPPPDVRNNPQPAAGAPAADAIAGSVEQAQPQAADAMKPKPLPDGWVALQDQHGQPYYRNDRTGLVQRVYPTAEQAGGASEAAAPNQLYVSSGEEPQIDGLYTAVAGELVNGQPVWGMGEGRIFAAADGSWVIAEVEEDLRENMGIVKSSQPRAAVGRGFKPPQAAGPWLHADEFGGWAAAAATHVSVPTQRQTAEASRMAAAAAAEEERRKITRNPASLVGRWRAQGGVYTITGDAVRGFVFTDGTSGQGQSAAVEESEVFSPPAHFPAPWVVLLPNDGAMWIRLSGVNEITALFKSDRRSQSMGFISRAVRMAEDEGGPEPPPSEREEGDGGRPSEQPLPMVLSVSGCKRRKGDGAATTTTGCPLQHGRTITVRGRGFGTSGAGVYLFLREPGKKPAALADRLPCGQTEHDRDEPAELLRCVLPDLPLGARADVVVSAVGFDGERYEAVLRGGVRTVSADREKLRRLNLTDFKELGVGGLGSEFAQLFRRAFATRLQDPDVVRRLGVKHVRGILLHGPPGTGKTLLARRIGAILGASKVHTVNGPEIMSKYVGQSEQNLRKLFKNASAAAAAGDDDDPQLQLIIFDEIDAIMKQRGGSDDSAARAVYDGVTTQLLSLMDGMSSDENILVIGLTNRLDAVDKALLRPGRFEVKIKIALPDAKGRHEIFQIHTQALTEAGYLGSDVDLRQLARDTPSYTGADIEGVVKSAASFALGEIPPGEADEAGVLVKLSHFRRALQEVQPSHGAASALDTHLRRGIIHYSTAFSAVLRSFDRFVHQVRSGRQTKLMRVVLEGKPESGLTAVASYAAKRSGFPFVHLLSMEDMVGKPDHEKLRSVQDVFEDAYMVEESVIILDKLELLVEYSNTGRISSTLQQGLTQLLARQPTGKGRVMVVITTNSLDVLRFMHTPFWDFKVALPLLDRANAATVLRELEVFESDSVVDQAVPLLPPQIGIKRLIWMVDQARVRAGIDEDVHLRGKEKQSPPFWQGKTQFVVHPPAEPDGSTLRTAEESPPAYVEHSFNWGWMGIKSVLGTSVEKEGIRRSRHVPLAVFLQVLEDAGLREEELPTLDGLVL